MKVGVVLSLSATILLIISGKNYFRGVSEQILSRAETGTFRYILDDLKGEVQPVITSAFWGDVDNIYSNDNWREFLVHSGGLIENECSSDDVFFRYIENGYEFSVLEMDIIKSIWELKKNKFSVTIQLEVPASLSVHSPIEMDLK